jgi:hypothetical protein
VGPRAGLDGGENLVPTGIRSRTIQPVDQSLYRLSYPAHKILRSYRYFTDDHRPIGGYLPQIFNFYTAKMGTAVTQQLRCCATIRKVAGSIPDGVIGIFH